MTTNPIPAGPSELYLALAAAKDQFQSTSPHRKAIWQAMEIIQAQRPAASAPKAEGGQYVGFRFRVCPKEYRNRPWDHPGIVAEWNKPLPEDNDTIEYQAIYRASLTRELPAAELWCLHLQGPDDVHAAPSQAHAQKAADMVNKAFAGVEVSPNAVAARWPHSAESHAESVVDFITDWIIPKADIDAAKQAPPASATSTIGDKVGGDGIKSVIGASFLNVLRNPNHRWHETEAWKFIEMVADHSGAALFNSAPAQEPRG